MYRKIFAVLVGSLASITLSNAGPLGAERIVKGILEMKHEDQKGDGWEFRLGPAGSKGNRSSNAVFGTLTFNESFNRQPVVFIQPQDQNVRVLRAEINPTKIELQLQSNGNIRDFKDAKLFSFMAIEQ